MPSPHVRYQEPTCPYDGCPRVMEWIDFRLEVYEDQVERPLMIAWWAGVGFAGRCPTCGRWIHFSPVAMLAVSDEEVGRLPQMPPDWHTQAEFH